MAGTGPCWGAAGATEPRKGSGRLRLTRWALLLLAVVLGSGPFGGDRAFAATRKPSSLTLFTPQYLPCGKVTVNGVVDSGPTRISWDWGDGTIKDSFFPASHEYSANGDFPVHVSAFVGSTLVDSGDTTAYVTNAEDSLCAYSVRVSPTTVALRSGGSSRQLVVDLRGPAGEPISLSGKTVSFMSSNPALVSVDSSGIVSSAGFGEAQVTASVTGYPRKATALVVAGDFRLEPPITLLTPSQTQSVTLQAFNADGTVLLGHSVHFLGGNEVASVTDSGLITAIRAPVSISEIPYLFASIDGILLSHNNVVARVTSSPLGLTLRDEPGDLVSLRFSDQVGQYPFGALVQDLQAATVLDNVYRLEQRLTEVTPNRGDRQYLVLDPGHGADGTVPCGLSGNPIRLGISVDDMLSCFGGADFLHWGVMAHEMGHNFTSFSFFDFAAQLPNGATFVEGIASFLGFAAIEELLRVPFAYGLQSQAAANLARSDIFLAPAFDRAVFFPELTAYEAQPDYPGALDADELDAILIRLYDEFGPHFAFRLFSAFVPPDEPVAFNLATEGQRLAFFVAACSAAARVDLKERFQTKWGFPLDSSFYDAIYPKVAVLVARREGGIFSDCLTTPRGPACGSGFYTLSPCRVADTRDPAGPSGGPALSANAVRTFPVVGVCGIPSSATAVAINMAIWLPSDDGDLRFHPAGGAAPLASTINFRPGIVRANNAVVPLGAGGQVSIQCDMPAGSTGSTHVFFDVYGYFQ